MSDAAEALFGRSAPEPPARPGLQTEEQKLADSLYGGKPADPLANSPWREGAPKPDGPQSEKPGAPEAYQPFELPEGVEPDGALLEAFTPVARELGLSQGQTQRLVAFHSEQVRAQEAAQMAQAQQWTEEVRRLPEFAGAQFDRGVREAQRGLDYAAGPDRDAVRELLERTGLGNHPLLVKAFRRVGRGMAGED